MPNTIRTSVALESPIIHWQPPRPSTSLLSLALLSHLLLIARSCLRFVVLVCFLRDLRPPSRQIEDQEDLKPSATPGYKPGAAKTAEEYAKLDAEDESLARWKASLGITSAVSQPATGPRVVTVLTLELDSPTLPAGKKIALDLKNVTQMAETKKNPIIIKEGVEYNVRISFKVNHSIISGVRYIQLVKRAAASERPRLTVDKMEQMLGSYGPNPTGEPYIKNFDSEESPSGMIARSGTYNVRSRVVDDDGEVYAGTFFHTHLLSYWEWYFKLAKEW
ncbi:E set domain-containing protein [Fistulina hepatica ATCC 64428]|nr:E set domain-containing protein [Fistulina hepatica ATCC 64428]